MKLNFKESKLVFFEGGQADKFVPKIQAVEKKVQAEKEKSTPETGKEDIVDESKVKDKIDDIEKKIKESPVSDKYKDQIEKSLTTLLDKKEKDLKKVDVKKENKLKALFDKILVDLDGFKDQPDVKDIYETIEPFFKNKDKITPIINLKTYRRRSAHWKEINANLEKKAGITKDQINKIQKILKVRNDRKVGPETINALASMLDEKVSVKFDDKETFYDGESKSVEQKTAELGQIPEEDSAVTDGKKVKEPEPAKPAKTEPKEAPKAEAPKVEAPKAEAPKVEAPKVEAPKVEAPTATEKPVEAKPRLPANLESNGFYFDSANNLRAPGYDGNLIILHEPRSRFIEAGGIIHTSLSGIQRYLRPGGNPVTDWKSYQHRSVSEQEIVNNRLALGLPEKIILGGESKNAPLTVTEKFSNLKDKGFYQVEKDGKLILMRSGNSGTYILQSDGSVIYTWPNGGKAKLSAGANADKGWEVVDEKGKEAASKQAFQKNLDTKGFYYSEDGKLRRKGFNGVYEIQKNNDLIYTWENGGKSKLAGGDLNKQWEHLDDKASTAAAKYNEEKDIKVNIGPGEYISLERAREIGFAKPSVISEAEVMINQFTQQQKQDMMKSLLEGKELTPEQNRRLQQIGILKTALQSLLTDIKTNRTWGEWDRQVNEFDGTTNARLLWVGNKIQELDNIAAKVLEDPNATIGQLVDGHTKRFLLDHKLNETAPFLMDAEGRINEAKSLDDLQGQYFGLVQFLRDKKDYASAQNLIEDNLLGPQFAAKRALLEASEKAKVKGEATRKIYKMASSYAEEWNKEGLTQEQQDGYIHALIDEEAKRGLNKVVAEMNKGLPFSDAKGWDKSIMESYKDMMGTGEWHNLSDSSWDTIVEEVMINAPLIILSGGVASVARAGLTAGARSLVAAARLTRFGIATARMAEGLEATGAIGRSLYWSGSKVVGAAGKLGGLAVEGTVFETVYSGLHGENLFEGGWEKFPEWGKRIFWSSASLGAFHIAGNAANKVNNVILKHLSKFPDKSVRAAIQKLIVTGSAETAAMLGIGAIQHYEANGDFKDYDLSNELFHALVSVGALKVAGGAVEVGKKRFFPGPEGGPVEMSTAEREANAKLREEAAKKTEEDYKKSDIKTGDEVTLKAENGTEEAGWKVEVSAPNGQVIVSKIIDGKFKSKYVDKAKILADNANGPSKKADANDAKKTYELIEWAKQQLQKISDVEIRKKTGEILKGLGESLGSGSKKSLESLRIAWNSISDAVGRSSKELQQKIDGKIKERESKKSKTVENQESTEARSRRVNSEAKEYKEVSRETDVAYIPDIHGDVVALKNSLNTLGLIDAKGKWIGGKKVVQFSGDYIDRGSTNLATLDFVMDITQQAKKAGGRVDLLMGNHEALMIGTLLGNLKLELTWRRNGGDKVIQEVIDKHGLKGGDADAQALSILRDSCFKKGGKYYDLIHSLKPASQVDDVLYVHAGISPKWAEKIRTLGVEGVNKQWAEALRLAEKGDFKLFDEFNEIGKSRQGNAEHGGLFWIDFEAEIETMTDRQVAEVATNLKAAGINAIVVGHSKIKNPRLAENFDKYGVKIVASDVGMSEGYRKAKGSGKGGVVIDRNGNISAESNEGSHSLHQEAAKAEVPTDNKVDVQKVNKFKEFADKQLQKISDLKLREGAKEVVVDLGKATKAAFDSAKAKWANIRKAVAKYGDAFVNEVDKKMSELGEKFDKVLGRPITIKEALIKIKDFATSSSSRAGEIFDRNGKNAERFLAEGESLLAEIEKNPDFRKNPELLSVYERQKLIVESVRELHEFNSKTNELVRELYPRGIESDLIQSGRVGNCYLIASLKSLKATPELMREMIGRSIKKTGPGKWEVTFLGGDRNIGSIEVTEAKISEWKSKNLNVKGAKGDLILELAYASYKSRLNKKGKSGHTMIGDINIRNGKVELAVEGGLGHRALADLLGSMAVKHAIVGNDYNRPLIEKNVTENVVDLMRGGLDGVVVTANTPRTNNDTKPFTVEGQQFWYSHAYSVVGYESKGDRVVIANPHDSSNHISMSMNGFLKTFADVGFVRISRLGELGSKLKSVKSPEIATKMIRDTLNKYSTSELAGFNSQKSAGEMRQNIEYVIDQMADPKMRSIVRAELQAKFYREGTPIILKNYGT